MNYLNKLWPGSNRIKECLSTDAENIPEHILLAVHQSIDLYWKNLEIMKARTRPKICFLMNSLKIQVREFDFRLLPVNQVLVSLILLNG